MLDLDDAKYISFTTFKRDGTPKAVPVWITGSDGSYLFTTGADAWKTKRLRNDPRVEAQVCDMRGRVAPEAPVYRGTAEVLADESSIAAAKQALADKYGWQATLARMVEGVRGKLGRGEDPVAIRITLDSN
jgi:hypothetical protein